MEKTRFRAVRVTPTLDERIMDAAEKRGMNFSEFVRYALVVFFDQADDSVHQNAVAEPRPTYESEPA